MLDTPGMLIIVGSRTPVLYVTLGAPLTPAHVDATSHVLHLNVFEPATVIQRPVRFTLDNTSQRCLWKPTW